MYKKLSTSTLFNLAVVELQYVETETFTFKDLFSKGLYSSLTQEEILKVKAKFNKFINRFPDEIEIIVDPNLSKTTYKFLKRRNTSI